MADILPNSPVPAAPARPTLLTVLCILTFIGSAYGVFRNIKDYINADAYGAIITRTMDQVGTDVKEATKDKPEAEAFVNKVVDNAAAIADPAKLKKKALYNLIADILAFAGAFLMFNLRKVGFWVYLLHVAIAIIAPLAVYGTNNMVVNFGMAGLAAVSILFSVLYSLNLKHMS